MAQYTITFVEIYVTSVPRSILLRMYDEHFRDSRPEMLYKKRCSEAFREDHRKTPSIVPFLLKNILKSKCAIERMSLAASDVLKIRVTDECYNCKRFTFLKHKGTLIFYKAFKNEKILYG